MTIITIGLIELVAALNILITLVMMVMEKYRDIAILMSMGARHQQIRAHLHAAGRADRRGGHGDRAGRSATRSPIWPTITSGFARRRGLLAGFVPFEPRPLDALLDRRGGHRLSASSPRCIRRATRRRSCRSKRCATISSTLCRFADRAALVAVELKYP